MKFKWLCCADSEESMKSSDPIPQSQPALIFAHSISTYLQKNSETLNKLMKPENEFPESLDFPILNLNIEESASNQQQTKYRIFYYGLEHSPTQGGVVYIGEDNNSNLFVSSEVNLQVRSLCIFFDLTMKKFFIKDLNLTTFIKILKDLKVEGRLLLSFIDKRIIVAANKNKIIVKTIESENEFEFSMDDGPVTVGRSETCSVKVTGKNISRVQCTFYYDQGWIVKDGGSSASLNGTWFMPLEQAEVTDGMIFNANRTIFSATFEKTPA
jgi:hypothetical protein